MRTTIWPNRPPGSWVFEESEYAVVTWPNVWLDGLMNAVPVGLKKLMLLNALISSPRSWKLTRSVIRIPFTTLRSKRVSLGPVRKMLYGAHWPLYAWMQLALLAGAM